MEVHYSSPRMKGRNIYGALVPFGKVWRLGANEATTFVVSYTSLLVMGKEIPPGTYTLFAIPDQNQWTLVISKKTDEWGIPYPGESYDLLRVEMKLSPLPSPVEEFTISFDKTLEGCTMNVDWETTRASEVFTVKKLHP